MSGAEPDGPLIKDGLVCAAITVANANAMSDAGDDYIAASPTADVNIDMRNVDATSVAVAVSLAWLASAARHSKALHLSNLSADFNGVIEFSGISSMFADHVTNPLSNPTGTPA